MILIIMCLKLLIYFFFFNDTATTEIYTLSLHDALPISVYVDFDVVASAPAALNRSGVGDILCYRTAHVDWALARDLGRCERSEEHTSELQSRQYLVCRLLLEKKKKTSTHVSQF